MTITQDALDDATRLLRGHGYTLRAPTVTSFASAEVFRLICQRCDTHFHARAIANECPPCAAATEEHGLQPVGDVSGA